MELPKSDPDIHIVVGPNESGKSTVMRALEDLLFKIPDRSPMNFRHKYAALRLGAEIESNGATLVFKRRKGRKNTILSPDDQPMAGGELALAPFVGEDITRPFFERFFSLDHNRLRTGGQEILEAKGDLGEALFSAGSGLEDLSKIRRELAAETNELWSKRRSKRKYFQAKDRLDTAKRACKKYSVSASDWKQRRKEYERCQEMIQTLNQDLVSQETKLTKNSRIRRVARHVRDKARFETEMKSLDSVASLPENARKLLTDAQGDLKVASQRAADQDDEWKRVMQERSNLKWEESILLRAADIKRLHARWIVSDKGKEDLVKREAELSRAEDRLRDLGAELGWDEESASSLAEKIPPRATVADARRILNDGAKTKARVEEMERAVKEAENTLQEADRTLRALRVSADISRLAPLVSAARERSGGLGPMIRAAEDDVAAADARAQALLTRLRPAVESLEMADGLSVPAPGEVKVHRDARSELNRDLIEYEKRIRDSDDEIARCKAERDRIERNEQPVTREQVIKLRDKRDSGWDLVRRIHIEGSAATDEEVLAFTGNDGSLATAYESAVEVADRAVDRSVETASAVARLAEAERAIEAEQSKREAFWRELQELEARSDKLEAEWRVLWQSVPFAPLEPEAMLPWLDLHEKICQALGQKATRSSQLAHFRDTEANEVSKIVEELGRMGIDPGSVQDKGLRYVLDFAAAQQQSHENAAADRTRIEQERGRAEENVATKRRDLKSAKAAEEALRSQWAEVAIELGLRVGRTPGSAEEQFLILDQMRGVRAEIEDLRHRRIRTIRRDITEFEDDLSRTVSVIDPSLSASRPDEAVLKLMSRLRDAQQASQDALTKETRIKELEAVIRGHKDKVRSAKEEILKLQAVSGAETVEELRCAIAKAERRRHLESEIAKASQILEQDGDGRSVEELEAECRGIDLDRAKSLEEGLREYIKTLRSKLGVAHDQLREAESRLSEIGGDDAGAVAESAKQSALAEIDEIAERFVRTCTAELLVGWAIDRYRREKQGPTLKRAGELFSELTLGSFEGLELDYDKHDRPRLVGRRPDGERVKVEGLSQGSVDQLYLALRVSALEDYAERKQCLPFIADDLFINFDDLRAEAGLKILGRLAQQCQVIFFTHHDHLSDIAERALEGKARVWRMAP